ncbi:unnamed protein product [Gulo gulo]|uniref:Uncharacterized protein n=1 Tax=Gulo gulo TaxID=48420 RepID=A0A9X9LTH9_GULGU|nr:unnamed protein product [Gulo gulo]
MPQEGLMSSSLRGRDPSHTFTSQALPPSIRAHPQCQGASAHSVSNSAPAAIASSWARPLLSTPGRCSLLGGLWNALPFPSSSTPRG